MKTLTITLPDETINRLEEAARRAGVSVEELVEAGVEEQLERLRLGFEEASEHVLKKNAELYRRLA